MSLSKKHFEKVAEILNQELKTSKDIVKKEEYNPSEHEAVLETIKAIEIGLSDYFATENPLFDRERFKQAVLKEVD